MARSTICTLDGREISVEKAIELRDTNQFRKNNKPNFRCMECGHSVRPHNAGGIACAHFEHLKRNPNCGLSDPAR
jgi:lipopolysaccharide biosynthesis regulator YciM